MKKLFFTFSLLFIAFIGTAQISPTENFEVLADSVYDDPGTGNPTWAITNLVANSGVQSYTSPVTITPNAARTMKFVTQPNTFVTLSFYHICRIDFQDVATLEYSIDTSSGVWFQIDGSSMDPSSCTYQTFAQSGNNFWSSASTLAWDPATPGTPANNSMWCRESFDISSLVANFPEVYIRWSLVDGNGDGSGGYPGWYIDDIQITQAACELNPPVHNVSSSLSGTVYSLGPYSLSDSIVDNSGIASANIVYTINGVVQTPVPMAETPPGSNIWVGTIPAVADSDTICYYFEATDASSCANYSRYPDPSAQCFVATTGIGFPFCDNFDSQNLWSNTTVTGSGWDLGTPTSNPSAPHSAPNSWEVAINNQYLNSTECYLNITQPVSFIGITNAYVEFWFYSDCENSWDGTRLEYRTAGNTTWRVLGGQATGTNWYNDASINSSNLPAWTGSGITGASAWTKAKHTLPPDVYGDPSVEFQFVFTSDGSVADNGFAIDDFCLIVPPPNDASLVQVSSPSGQYPADSCASVTVTISNEGTLTLSSIPITYINQSTGHTVTETWTGSLAPNTTANYTFTVCDSVAAGSSCLQIFTDLTGDGNHFNDSIVVCPFGIPTFNLTACDDFESGATGWLGSGQWQLGTPAFGATTGAHSGVNAWDINLTGPYANNVTDTLYSPFYNVAGVVNPYLRFWHNRNTETGNAGYWIEYSINNAGWQTLGSTTSGSNATNWYNQTSIAFGGNGWDGNSNGWVKSTFSLASVFPPNVNIVRFRIVWDAAFGTPLEGVSIDDFCVVAPPPIDAGVVAITAPIPIGQLPAGDCVPVTVTIKNFGTTNLTSVPVTYLLGTQTGTATYTGNLAPNATATVTISTPCLTIPTGPFTLCAYSGVTGDGDSSNDTTCVDGIGIPVLNPSACLDFEANNGSWIPANGNATSSWEWGTPAFGATTGAHGGVNAWDVSLQSAYLSGLDDTLYTTYYNVIGAINPYLSFWQNRNTFAGDDGFWLEYTVNNGQNWQTLPAGLNGLSWHNQPNLDFLNQEAWDGNSQGWVKSTYFLSNVLAGSNKVRFRFIFHSTGFGTTLDGVSIDDFCVNLPPADDAGVISVVSASGGILPQGNQDSVLIDVRNYGINTITSVGVTYHVMDNSGAIVFTSPTVNWSGNLLSNQTFGTTSGLLIHPDKYTIPTGEYSICAWTTLTGDGDATNDTSCSKGVGVPVIPIDYNTSYCDDFEGTNIGWTATLDPAGNPASIWELGNPAFGSTTGAYSGQQCWDINLTTGYSNNANAILTSPIFDFTNAVDTKLNFWRNHTCEGNWDGTRLEFRIGSNPWTVLGTCTTTPPTSLNWYNDCTINSSGLDAWNGNSGGWVNSIWYKLDSYGGFNFNNAPTVQFRYIFTSDGSVQQDGFSIDDFCLEVPVPLTSTPTAVGSTNVPSQLIFPGQCITFKGTLKNDGTTALNSMVATLKVDGNTQVVDTVSYATPLASGAAQVHNFSSCWTATPGAHNICVITSLPNNSADLKPSGDTVCYSIVVLDSVDVSQSTYCNDFENPLAPEWLTLNSITYSTNSSWKLGNPAKPTIPGPHSGSNCWVTALDSLLYENRDSSSLFTPVFRVVPGLPYSFEFWGNFDAERNEDGGTVEYSTDYASTWNTLGNERDSVWMNTYNITALGSAPPVRPGWSGSSSTQWERRKHYLCITNPVVSQVIFRFKFASDFSIRAGGWGIDDVCFKLDLSMPLCVVGVNNIDEELGFSLEQNIPNPFNNQTIINFNLLKPGKTSLVITNIMGQVVDIPVNDRLLPGSHSVTIDGNKLSAGVYYYTLNYEGKKLTKKMVITE